MAGKSDGPGTRSGKRLMGIHEANGSAAPRRVLQSDSGAAVVSAAPTHSRPCLRSRRILRGTVALGSREERLKSLRPRADGKVASVRGLETRGGEAARRSRGQPRPTRSMSQVT